MPCTPRSSATKPSARPTARPASTSTRFVLRSCPAAGPSSWRAAPTTVGRSGPRSPSSPTAVPTIATTSFDPVHGEIALGPAVRQPDGTYDQYGWVPPKGADMRMAMYTVGGGAGGNVARRTISDPAHRDPVRVAAWRTASPRRVASTARRSRRRRARGPIVLRTRSRAVTAEDYELLTKQAAPEVARVQVPHRRRRSGRRFGQGPARPRECVGSRRDRVRPAAPVRRDTAARSPIVSTKLGSSALGCSSSRRCTRASPWSPASWPRRVPA